MLHCGERVGVGDGAPAVDVAVDPVEGTNLLAKGLPNAISAIAIAPRGSLWRSRASYYMDKLVVGPEAAGRVHLDAPVRDNLAAVAEARGVAIGDLLVVILDRPRNEDKITAVRAAGSRVRLISDGDVAPALMTAMPEAPVDVVMGIGGTPEGVLTACALTGLGGEIQGRLAPQSDAERTAIELEGTPLDAVLTMADLVRDPDTYFSATGITTGDLLHGVKRNGTGRVTNSVVCSGRSGRWQVIRSRHPD
jgi:fructose-1,6-bisphosphatase II